MDICSPFLYGKFIVFDSSPCSNAVATMAVVWFFTGVLRKSFLPRRNGTLQQHRGFFSWWHRDQLSESIRNSESWGLATAVGALESLKWGVKMFQGSLWDCCGRKAGDVAQHDVASKILVGNIFWGFWPGFHLILSQEIRFDHVHRTHTGDVWDLAPNMLFGWCFWNV